MPQVYNYARVGKMRLGASRLDYYQPFIKITINGTDRASDGTVRIGGLSIQDLLDGTPNTATMRVDGFTPTKGQEVKIALGQMDSAHYVFCGHILKAQQIYEAGKPANIAYDLSCISYEWLLNRRKVTVKYTNTSASSVVTSLMSSYTSGFTTANVALALATLDEITFTNEDVTTCLDRIAKRIGGYWYVDYAKDLHFFVTAESVQSGDITTAVPRSGRNIVSNTDLSQVRTRVYGEGGGSAASINMAAGATTLPVDDSSWYSSSGGTVVSGPQRVTYTGKSAIAGTGSTVAGKLLSPGQISSASAVAGTSGNLRTGTFLYKTSFVTPNGESEIAASSQSGSIADVSSGPGNPTLTGNTGGSLTTLSTYYYAVSFATVAGEKFGGSIIGITLTGAQNRVDLTSISTSGDARVTARNLYRTRAGGGAWYFLATINDNSTTTYNDTIADTGLGVGSSLSSTSSGCGQMSLTGIPTGPADTTSRRVYRTQANGSTYKLLTTIGDNATTTYTDNTGDASLGSSAPLGSAIGTNAADTSLRVVECANFSASGGWLNVASQVVSYTGRSVSSGEGNLTGIPANGTGAITANISVGQSAVNAPHLTGVSGIVYAILQGDEVNVLATVNDTTAQTNMAGFVGGDGIHEDYLQDNRLSLTEATARATAQLTLVKDPLVTMTYETRDQTARSGRTVTFNLSAPTSITGTFKIQSVTMTDFDPLGRHFPRRVVEASSRRFTFESLLRLFKAA